MKRNRLLLLLARSVPWMLLALGVFLNDCSNLALAEHSKVDTCATEPLTTTQLRSHVINGILSVLPAISGTPSSESNNILNTNDAIAAESAVALEATLLVQQFVACGNDGNVASAAALLSDSGADYFLALSFASFVQNVMGQNLDADADTDLYLIDLFVGSLQVPQSLPQPLQVTVTEIEDVRVFTEETGFVLTKVVIGSGSPRTRAFRFELENGSYRLSLGPHRSSNDASTPIASP